MSEPIWHVARDGRQEGPLTREQVADLIHEGVVRPETLVWRMGMAAWTRAADVAELAPLVGASAGGATPPPPPPPPGDGAGPAAIGSASAPAGPSVGEIVSGWIDEPERLPHLRPVGAGLDLLGRLLGPSVLDSVDRAARFVGAFAYPLAGLVVGLLLVLLGIRLETWEMVAAGLLVVPVGTLLAHYAAALFLDAGRELIAEHPSRLGSRAFLRSFALVAMAAAFGGGFLMVVSLLDGDVPAAVGSLTFALLSLYAGGIALTPAAVAVTTSRHSAPGREAVRVMLFLGKLGLRLVPVLFGLAAAAGVVTGLWLAILALTDDGFLRAAAEGPELAATLTGLALLPVGAWLAYLLLVLFVDLVRSVLSIPRWVGEGTDDGADEEPVDDPAGASGA